MSDIKDLKEPYPFVNARYMEKLVGRHVALVGKIEKVDSLTLTVRTSDGK